MLLWSQGGFSWWLMGGLCRSIQRQQHPSLSQMTTSLGATAGTGQSYSEIKTQGSNVSNPFLWVSAKYASIWGMSPPIDSFLSCPFVWLSPLNKVVSLEGQPWGNRAKGSVGHQYPWPLYCGITCKALSELSLPSCFSRPLSAAVAWRFSPWEGRPHWCFITNVIWCLLRGGEKESSKRQIPSPWDLGRGGILQPGVTFHRKQLSPLRKRAQPFPNGNTDVFGI